MREPIFVRTRTHYDSYQDFWRLVELAGFRTRYVDEIRLDADATYIVTPINGEVRPHIANERVRVGWPADAETLARLVVWALERPDSPTARPWASEVSDLLAFFDEVWVSDRSLEQLDTRARFVPMGSDTGLGAPGAFDAKVYDVAFMGYMIPRRDGIAHALRQRGISIAPNGWGAERAATLVRTRIMLNVHQHERPMPIGEPLRIALAAAFRMALVSETLADPYPLTVGMDFEMAPYGDLAARVEALLAHPAQLHGLGQDLYARLCIDHRFAYNVRNALEVF